MRNKIFKSVFATVVAVMLVTFWVLFAWFYNVIKNVAGEDYNVWLSAIDVIAPAIVLFTGVSIVAFVVATLLSKSVTEPINNIDPEHPESAKVYEELRPIVDKLSSQNYKITRQMNLLRKRENEFNSITSNMSEGLIVINSRAAILSCNKSAREIFGLAEEPPRSVLMLHSSRTFRDAIGAVLAGKNGYDSIRDGDKYYSLFATPVLNGGNVDGAVIVVIDVTEKEGREALRREFTSNISHELKTPLTSISGFAEVIKSGMAEEDEVRHFAENIHKEASRLISLVGDIIRLTQLDGGEIPYDDEKIDLYALADEVVERLSGIAERADVTITLDGEHAVVDGNSTAIEEIIYNLCDNAIKYNRAGGSVRIRVNEAAGEAVLRVSDDGIGIPKDKQDRVFERFYRVDKSHSKAIGGTGLGLSIVKHAAAYHKAHLTLESDEGVGTTVTVAFPKAKSDI